MSFSPGLSRVLQVNAVSPRGFLIIIDAAADGWITQAQ
jgi:hypothetical protein